MKNNYVLSYLLTICVILSGMAFAIGGGGGGGSGIFNIDDSYSDVFVTGAGNCVNPNSLRWTLSGKAATIPNRQAQYLAADVQVFADGKFRTRPNSLTERNGPISSVITPTAQASLTCALLIGNPNSSVEAKGWHKGIAQSNDTRPGAGNITRTTVDRLGI